MRLSRFPPARRTSCALHELRAPTLAAHSVGYHTAKLCTRKVRLHCSWGNGGHKGAAKVTRSGRSAKEGVVMMRGWACDRRTTRDIRLRPVRSCRGAEVSETSTESEESTHLAIYLEQILGTDSSAVRTPPPQGVEPTTCALGPSPRLAKPFQISQALSPPVRALSACGWGRESAELLQASS